MKKLIFILIFIFILAFSVNACETGQRTDTEYCDVYGNWQPLKTTGESCQNNFECSQSDVCQDNVCVKSDIIEELAKQKGLLQQILAFLSNKCWVIGERIDDEFCNSDSQWEDQKSEGDSCEYDYECTTNYCENGICSVQPTGNGGDSGDGGGRGSSRRGGRNIIDYIIKRFSNVLEGREYNIRANHMNIPVTRLTFVTSTTLRHVKFKVSRIYSTDLIKPPGFVYMYFDLEPEKIVDEDVIESTIMFRVDKTWLEKNDINENTMKLYKYTDKWIELPTKIEYQDMHDFYYFSTMEGFSMFAITSIPRPTITQQNILFELEPKIECGNDVMDEGENCATCPEDIICLENEICKNEECAKKPIISKLVLILSIIAVIALIIIIIIYVKSSKPTKIKKIVPTPKPATKTTKKKMSKT